MEEEIPPTKRARKSRLQYSAYDCDGDGDKTHKIQGYIDIFVKTFPKDKVHLAHSWAEKTLVQLLTRYKQVVGPTKKSKDAKIKHHISRARKMVSVALIQSELEGASTAATAEQGIPHHIIDRL